ncbi:hypothetical protein, partial [Avibacterium paragallinarum]|uniref:hypothetical protein n=1 Tax=Avibacterium paragallinarum TaxID=728 RepID=UPI001F178238
MKKHTALFVDDVAPRHKNPPNFQSDYLLQSADVVRSIGCNADNPKAPPTNQEQQKQKKNGKNFYIIDPS